MKSSDPSFLPGFQRLVVEMRVTDERVQVEEAHAEGLAAKEPGRIGGNSQSKTSFIISH